MATVELQPRFSSESGTRTAFLIVDTESIPDGRLLNLVKYSGENLSEEEAIERARTDARDTSWTGSDFISVSFQIPVGICVIRVGGDLSLQKLTCLDSPHFRPREIVKQFWVGVGAYPRAKLVTFNGRGFDLPLLELGAFRYGLSGKDYYLNGRNRFNGHIDLLDWFTNFGAFRLQGGLDLLAKLLGKPGKMEVSGDQVLQLYREGRNQEINDYCLCDTLDTYFIFLRTRVITGDITAEMEQELVARAREFLESRSEEFPVLHRYLDNWVDVPAWP
jgi:predicted PolB exonuclease-like 3'-5' exonuclease